MRCIGATIMASTFRLQSKEDVALAIRKRGRELAATMDDREIFLSPEFRQYALRLVDFILRKHKLYSLDIQYNPDMDTVAYTDGKKIFWNTGNHIAQVPKLLEGRFKANMGILFHEAGHKLFLDFKVLNKALETVENGKLYGKVTVTPGSPEEGYLQELNDAMDAGFAGGIARIYAELSNIITDGHDEAAMKECFPGFVASSIEAAGNAQMTSAPTLSDMIAAGRDTFSILTALMLWYSKFGYYKVGTESADTEKYLDRMRELEPVIDEALQEHDYKKRWNHFNMLVVALWPEIKDMIEQAKANGAGNGSQDGAGGSQGNGTEGQGNGGTDASGSDDGGQNGSGAGSASQPSTDDQLKEIIEKAMQQVSQENGVAPAPKGSEKAADIKAVMNGSSGLDQGDSGDIAAIASQVGEGLAKSQIQKELDQTQMDAIRNTKQPLIHSGIDVEIKRHFSANEEKYLQLYNDVAPYVRNLISEVLAFLRETNTEHLQRHKRYGPIIEATEAYRPDHAFFAKKKLPEDRPNMSICILLDESASMFGSKLEASKKALVMLERFATAIGIPLMIAGHHASGHSVRLHIYTDFLSTSVAQDRYALSCIEAHGCNRDGLPLRICADMLAKRQEEIRLMVVISDGAPSAYGYSGENAKEDIRKTVSEFRRKGLLIYGAAIDDDKEVIQSLYGQGFLSISDLRSLPKALVRLLRQNI